MEVCECRLEEVEQIMEEMDLYDVADDILDLEDGYQLVLSGWYVVIPELRIRLHEGVVGYWDDELKDYMPDFGVTVVFPEDPAEKEYLYFEQDGMVVTMANWLSGRKSIDAIEQLKCKIVIPHD